MRPHLVIFVKEPRPGRVKTRAGARRMVVPASDTAPDPHHVARSALADRDRGRTGSDGA